MSNEPLRIERSVLLLEAAETAISGNCALCHSAILEGDSCLEQWTRYADHPENKPFARRICGDCLPGIFRRLVDEATK